MFTWLEKIVLKFLLATSSTQYAKRYGKLWVKERGRQWEPLDEHMKREHPKR